MGWMDAISSSNDVRIPSGESAVVSCISVPPVNAMPSPTGTPFSA
jgi:hypothetical protein